MQVDSYIYNVKKLVLIFSSKESVIKAEVFQALKTVDSNFSFTLAHGNGKLFRETFSDSDITKEYKPSKMKIKYSIQFGLAPYFMQSI